MKKDGCRGKVRHATKSAAVAALKRVGNAGLRSYPCPKCKGWHLGTSRDPSWVQRRIDQLLGRNKK